MHGDAGKGDRYRPVDQKRYAENWKRIKWPKPKRAAKRRTKR